MKKVELKKTVSVSAISYGHSEKAVWLQGLVVDVVDTNGDYVLVRNGSAVAWLAAGDVKERLPKKARPAKKVQDNAIGQIYVSSWGYDQTNVDAFQVVRATEKTLYLLPIATEEVKGTHGHMCCNVRPVKDKFIQDFSRPKIRRMGKHLFPEKASSRHRSFGLWDGSKTYYCSWYA